MLIINAELDGQMVDVRLAEGIVAEIGAGLNIYDREALVDAKGGALLPGLHDHHIHMQASAAALASLRCGPSAVTSPDQLIEALCKADGDADSGGWLRGIGYHASVAGEIDRTWLDQNGPDRPIRIQHRGGRMWILNSRAIAQIPLDLPSDGRLVDRDGDLRAALGSTRPDLEPLTRSLLSRGVTGVTDATPGNDQADYRHLADACGPLRLTIMGGTALHGEASIGRAQTGPLKLHYHDYNLPPLADLAAEIAGAHEHGRPAAMHCVTRAEIMLCLAAFEEAGAEAGDRIEHAAIADSVVTDWIARLGLTVVTQPHFVTERGDAYLREVEPHELANLWPLKSFADAGVPLAAGSDAPFGASDPWQGIASACARPARLSAGEAISPDAALALYSKPADHAGAEPRRIEIGANADLCLLDRNWATARSDFSEVDIQATWIAGELVYDNISSTSPHSSAV